MFVYRTGAWIAIWSLWRIALTGVGWDRRRVMTLFVADSGRVYAPTARRIWDQLLLASPQIKGMLAPDVSQAVYDRLRIEAEKHGKAIYEALAQEHRTHLTREREKAEYAFAARRRSIGRIGLSEVRNHRLALLAQEGCAFQEDIDPGCSCPPRGCRSRP